MKTKKLAAVVGARAPALAAPSAPSLGQGTDVALGSAGLRQEQGLEGAWC